MIRTCSARQPRASARWASWYCRCWLSRLLRHLFGRGLADIDIGRTVQVWGTNFAMGGEVSRVHRSPPSLRSEPGCARPGSRPASPAVVEPASAVPRPVPATRLVRGGCPRDCPPRLCFVELGWADHAGHRPLPFQPPDDAVICGHTIVAQKSRSSGTGKMAAGSEARSVAASGHKLLNALVDPDHTAATLVLFVGDTQ